ncbi:hypothetical protein PTKIN_Ptkin16aG0018100 [Pterospermum kingtungense]
MAGLSCFAGALLEKLHSFLESPGFIKEHKESVPFLKTLESQLKIINSMIIDVGEKQLHDSSVVSWLEMVEDAVYDGEDAVDEILYELEVEVQKPKSWVQGLLPASIKGNAKWKRSIRECMKVFQAIVEYKYQVLRSRELKPAQNESPLSGPDNLRRFTFPWLDENTVYGREKDKCNIVHLLLSGDEILDSIALVGMGGLGKTTLAQLVYNDKQVRQHFDQQAWVCVGFDFDADRIIREILGVAAFRSPSSFERCMLDNKLRDRLDGKKLLLVLDDVWNEDVSKWWELKAWLMFAARACKIIVTTRSLKSAEIMGCSTRYVVPPLTAQYCWAILENSAFPGRDRREVGTGLEDIGWKIAEKCGGLPLVARVIGGHLSVKRTRQQWQQVIELFRHQTGDLILKTLWLSYYHLPAQLKRCFAYCSLFPKDYEFNKEELILLWMAEGFLRQSTEQSMEELGAEYFDILLKKSFFMTVYNSCFKMHDLMHDLAVSVSCQVCSFVLESNSMMGSGIPKRTRHLSLLEGQYDNADELRVILKTKRLRTFYLINFPSDNISCLLSPKALKVLFAREQRLRVLSLPHFQHAELPESIGKLKYLRYLDVSYSALERLPESLCTLYYLQTLILTNCSALHVLPQGIVKLVNLRKLQIKGTGLKQMPEEMGRLTRLQSLSNFIVGHGGSSIKELGALPHLHGSLSVSMLQNVSSASDALAANLKAIQYLDELVLEWSGDNEDSPRHQEEVLENLKPSGELTELSIRFYGGKLFPNWMGDSSSLNITSLYLGYCDNCESLPPLGQLPLLEHLIIQGCSGIKCVGREFYGVDVSGRKPFLSLKTLEFRDMSQWEELKLLEAEGKEFPCLEEFWIIDCPMFIGSLPKSPIALSKLEISGCEKLLASLSQAEESYSGKEPEISEYEQPAGLLSSTSEHHEQKLEKFNKMQMRCDDEKTVEPQVFPSIMHKEQDETLSESDEEIVSHFSESMSRISSNELLLELGETNENPSGQDDLEPSGKLENRDKVQMKSDDDHTVAPQVSPSLTHQQQDDDQEETLAGEDGNQQLPSSSSDFSSMGIAQNQAVATEVSSSTMHQKQVDNQEETLAGEDENQQLPSSSSDFSSMGIAQNQTVAPKVCLSTMHQEQDDDPEPVAGEDGKQQFSSSSLNVSSMDAAPLMEQSTDLHSLRIERVALNMLPKEILEGSSLQHLYIIDCVHLETFSLSPSLKTLYIHNCQGLKFPQPNKEKNQDVLLEDLCLGSSCDSLKIFPLSYFPKLKALSLWDCRNLEYLSIEKELHTELASLESVEIKDCPNFRSFLKEECQAPNLTSLVFFNCWSLKSLQWMQNFKALQSLYINKCPALELLPVEGLPSGLVILCFSFCDKITPQRGWKLNELQSLCHFEIEGGCLSLESFPEEGLLPTNLNSLRISRLSNLTSLDGKGFQNLTSLQTLEINCCDKLDSLPELRMPSSLSSLSITDCSLLNPKLQSRTGKEWFKIAHIPSIHLDEVKSHKQL